MGPQCARTHKRIAELVAEKKNKRYADVMNHIRTRLRFSLLKCVLIAIREARGKGSRSWEEDNLSNIRYLKYEWLVVWHYKLYSRQLTIVFRVKLLFLTIKWRQKMTAIKLLLIDPGVWVRCMHPPLAAMVVDCILSKFNLFLKSVIYVLCVIMQQL